jgi:hypothetical protein
MSAQLDRIHALARERRANEGLYPFQRTLEDTFKTLLCVLLGFDAITDEHLDAALSFVREGDERQTARAAS